MLRKASYNQIIILFGTLIGLIFIFLLGLIALSPYGQKATHDYKLIKESVIINAPVENVFQYLGNSDNASEWSVFVDHISTLNDDKIEDGTIGSIRRCFVNAEEKGEMWDEETLIVEPNKRRRLNCYNFQNFSLKADSLLTEQLYLPLNNRQCKLSFTLFFNPQKASTFEMLKMYYAAYTIADIFQKNLKNIKVLNENQLSDRVVPNI